MEGDGRNAMRCPDHSPWDPPPIAGDFRTSDPSEWRLGENEGVMKKGRLPKSRW